mgnify:CR=1 FL=1
MKPLIVAATISTLAPSGAVESWWGVSAHRAIATAATTLLTPAARRRAVELLDGRSLTTIATWADDIRRSRPHTDPWHYVNIPVDEFRYDSATHCRRGCVIEALRSQIRVLERPSVDRRTRGEALRNVVHFVSDLHQPLHVGDRQDRGGNDVKVTLDASRRRGRDRTRNPGQPKEMPLHAVWDSGIFEAAGLTEAALVNAIGRELGSDPGRFQHGEVLDWARETHAIAGSAYPPAGTTRLDRGWVDAAVPIAVTQMAKAAARLAATLNHALDPGSRTGGR